MTRQIILSALFILTNIVYGQKDSCKFTKTFYSNGHLHEEGCIIKGQREGLWNDYNEYDNKIRFIWTYKNNLKDGPYKVLGETGIIEATGKYSKGCLTDTLKSYNDKGQLTGYEVWKIDNLKSTKSSLVTQKTFIKPEKPDGTIETINGTSYMWQSGRKLKLK